MTSPAEIASKPGCGRRPWGSPRWPFHSTRCCGRGGGPHSDGGGRPEEHDRWGADGGGHVGDARVPADHAPGGVDDGEQVEHVGATGQHRGRRQRRRAERALRPSTRSSGAPVITTRRPAAVRARATSAHRSTGQRRACRRGTRVHHDGVHRSRRHRARRRSHREVVGIGREAGVGHEPAPPATSCSPGDHSGPSARPPQAKATSRRGRAASSSRWLCGPAPVEVHGDVGPGQTRRERLPSRPCRRRGRPARLPGPAGRSGEGVNSTSSCSGRRRRSARSAGTAVSRSPEPERPQDQRRRPRHRVAAVTARRTRSTDTRRARGPRSPPAGRGRTRRRWRRPRAG